MPPRVILLSRVFAILLLADARAAAQQESGARAADACPISVNDFDIEGVVAVDESELRDALEMKRGSWLPWREDPCFDAAAFEADLRRIVSFYAGRGYPHARVVESRVDRRGDAVSLHVVVNEGEPVRASEIVFSGFGAIAADRLEALGEVAPVRVGAPVADADVEETVRLATAVLANAGYAYARVTVRRDTAGADRVRLEFHAEPGVVAHFGSIDIAGNLNVDDRVIRRRLAYLPGQRFEVAGVLESQQRLEALGLFERVAIDVVPRDRPTPEVATRVTVAEGDFTRFVYSFGYGTEEQVSGELGWRHLNALGDARVFTVRGRWSSLDRGVESTLLERDLFGRPVAADLRGYVWHVDEPVFDVLSSGGHAGLRFPLGRRNMLEGRYSHHVERQRISRELLADAGLRSQLAALGLGVTDGAQDGVLAAIQIGANRDTTIDPRNPRGYRASVVLAQAGGWLPGAFNYYSVLGDGRSYRPIGGVTLAGRVRYGATEPMSAPSDVPFSRRYFLGGADSLRGWGRLEVSPRSPSGVPIGGLSFLTASAELRFPVAGPIAGVIFADGGNAWARPWELRLDDLRYDAGVGVRYVSPFGLLRVDVGYQLTPIGNLRVNNKPQDRRWRVHIAAGPTF